MNWLKLMSLLFIFSSCSGSQLFIEASAAATARLKDMPAQGTPGTFTFDGVTEYYTHYEDYDIRVQPVIKVTYRQYIFDNKKYNIK